MKGFKERQCRRLHGKLAAQTVSFSRLSINPCETFAFSSPRLSS